MPSEPDDGHRREVHDEHEHRHDDGEHASDLQRRVSEVAVRIREAGLLRPRSIECPHDANPREVLAQHQIDAVDLELHCLEQRDCPGHHDRDDSKHDGDDDEQEPGQLGILANRHDDRADGSHGREHHHRQARHHEHLNLLNVIGVASDERGHPNDIHLTERQRLDPPEQGPAHFAAKPHRGSGAVVNGHHRGHDERSRHREHDHADAQDVGDVALDDPVVDDVGVEIRQVQVGECLHEEQSGDDNEHAAMRSQVSALQPAHLPSFDSPDPRH